MHKSYLLTSLFFVLACHVFLLPFVDCLSHEGVETRKIVRDGIDHKLSPKKKSDIIIHGVLMWVSMGFLIPLGILAIRMFHRQGDGRQKPCFYIHVILQILSTLLVTAGAIMSIRSFENSFDNNHQRIGLALYGAIWVQIGTGFLRPHRRNKRSTWYFIHWILGTIVYLFGIINIYTGLDAYHKKTLRSTRIWTILFTAQVSCMAFLYLFQEKWNYIQKQGVILRDVEPITPNINQVNAHSDDNQQKGIGP